MVRIETVFGEQSLRTSHRNDIKLQNGKRYAQILIYCKGKWSSQKAIFFVPYYGIHSDSLGQEILSAGTISGRREVAM